MGGGNNNIIIRCPDYNLIYKLFIDDINEYDFNGSIPHSTKKATFNLYISYNGNERLESNICQNNTNSYSRNEPFYIDFKPSNSLIYYKSIPTNREKSDFSLYKQWMYNNITGSSTTYYECRLFYRPVFEFKE